MENEKSLIDKVRFYLSDTNKVAEALLLIRNTEKILEEAKEKVKERAVEIMDRENRDLVTYSITDTATGEIREWEIRRDYGSQSKEYRPENVIGALGTEKAFKFLKVSKSSLDTYLKRETAKGALPMELMEMAIKDPIMKMRKGSGVKMREIKAR
ncbi:MAG: hypothetical protein ACD_5C00075G0002 [uncultured bacterium]|nr:MAG: hypothetical protein ACD_5C00075G0002 [uncultured bacterium]